MKLAHAAFLVLALLPLSQVNGTSLPSPLCRSMYGFTACLTAYMILDEKHVMIQGTLEQNYGVTLRLLSLTGSASVDNVPVGFGIATNLPLDLPSAHRVYATATLTSYYTAQEVYTLGFLNPNQQVTVTVKATVCEPYDFWLLWWKLTGCSQWPEITWTHTYTIQELADIGQQGTLVTYRVVLFLAACLIRSSQDIGCALGH